MRIAFAADLQMLKEIARRAQARVGNQYKPRRRRIGHVERGNFDSPTLFPGRWIAGGHVSAARYQCPRNAAGAQNLERLIQGVALRDGPQIESHVRHAQLGRVTLRIEPELSVADQFLCPGQFGRVRESVFSTRFPPEAHDRSDGYVERAFGLFRQLLRTFKDKPELVAESDRLTGTGGL